MNTTPLTALSVTVTGTPVTQGSMKAITSRSTGKAIVIQDHRAQLMTWRELVASAVTRAAKGRVFPGPVSATVEFRLPRPKGHYGAKGLFPSRPAYPAVKPDVDKLSRAILDALTESEVITDDSRVVELRAVKRYADDGKPGASIALVALPGRVEHLAGGAA